MPGAPSGARALVLRPVFTPLVRKWAGRPMTTRLEAWRLRGLRRNGTGRPIGTRFPDLRPVGEQIHPAPPSRVARWLRCGGSHRWAGESLVLRQRGLRRLAFACSPRTSFPACLGTPRCVLSARATDAHELLLSRAREQRALSAVMRPPRCAQPATICACSCARERVAHALEPLGLARGFRGRRG
jgi:hypothetical protein